MDENLIRMFVLAGFLFQAIAFLPVRPSKPDSPNYTRFWAQGIAVLFFAIALILHIVGVVQP